jgi:hypothetical protein
VCILLDKRPFAPTMVPIFTSAVLPPVDAESTFVFGTSILNCIAGTFTCIMFRDIN